MSTLPSGLNLQDWAQCCTHEYKGKRGSEKRYFFMFVLSMSHHASLPQ